MKRIIILIGLLVLAHAAPVLAESSIRSGFGRQDDSSGYLRLGFGSGRTNLSTLGQSSDGYWGFGMEAAAGVTFSDRVRWDVVGLAYDSADVPAGGLLMGVPASTAWRLDLQTSVWIGDFSSKRRFHPFLGAGLGSARFSLAGADEWGFAWNAGAGFEFQLTSALAIGPRYTFRQVLLDGTTPDSDLAVNTHKFTFSIVWSN